MSLGKKAKHLRIKQGLSLRALAKKVGVSAATLSRFEGGVEEISHKTVVRVFAALERPLQIEPRQSTDDQVIVRFPFSIKRLAHFQCPQCLCWWFIGDKPDEKHWWYCPWCGKSNCFVMKDKA